MANVGLDKIQSDALTMEVMEAMVTYRRGFRYEWKISRDEKVSPPIGRSILYGLHIF